jgi:hypothetical protein
MAVSDYGWYQVWNKETPADRAMLILLRSKT